MFVDSFANIEELIEYAASEVEVSGSDSYTANRYPVRFVLFDNFRDSFQFSEQMILRLGCGIKSVEDWMDGDYPDTMTTYSRLGDYIVNYIKEEEGHLLIAPFSELARFYNNKDRIEFDALVGTIKSVQNSQAMVDMHRRVYIPVVGLENKMSKFEQDSQAFIWYFKNSDKQLDSRLIMTSGSTYGVKDLEEGYSVVSNVKEWLGMWKNKKAKRHIISTSPAIFSHAHYANPDNAFAFCPVENCHQFLTEGLGLDFGGFEYHDKDEAHWQRLAGEIDIYHFQLDGFVKKYFSFFELEDCNVFIKTWYECKDGFEKWLLVQYYLHRFCNKGYICHCLRTCKSYSNIDFMSAVALEIFGVEAKESALFERNTCMDFAAKRGQTIPETVQEDLKAALVAMNEAMGIVSTLPYLTSLTDAEKTLAIFWLGQGRVTPQQIEKRFPDLAYYFRQDYGPLDSRFVSYFDHYKHAKFANQYTTEIAAEISSLNDTAANFNHWYQGFKTTKTLLSGRDDIEVFYWVDGLGVEWIPYIKSLIEEKSGENIFLNEIMIGRAYYPTTTSVNKPQLEGLAMGDLSKIPNIDKYAHEAGRTYPTYILKEMKMVREAIEEIVSMFANKKVAIVSDHGLTALSQLCAGYNLGGIEQDHGGRLAYSKLGDVHSGDKYIVCDDGKTMCALRHESLGGKIHAGQSAHGGCTPEEVLVPILVISNVKELQQWHATLLTRNISIANPKVAYEIKPIMADVMPYITYRGKRYDLRQLPGCKFESGRVPFVKDDLEITLHVGMQGQKDSVKVNFGAEEDDLFDF